MRQPNDTACDFETQLLTIPKPYTRIAWSESLADKGVIKEPALARGILGLALILTLVPLDLVLALVLPALNTAPVVLTPALALALIFYNIASCSEAVKTRPCSCWYIVNIAELLHQVLH